MKNIYSWMTLIAVNIFSFGCSDEESSEKTQEDSPFAEIGPVEGITAIHNEIRRSHGVGVDLEWDESLAEISLQWLKHLETNNNCEMEHNWDSPLGENLMWATFYMEPEEVVRSWADEEVYYDYESNTCQEGEMCGHYTQIVWKDTTKVGCAMLVCENGSEHLWMCNYDPAGNWDNVRPY